MLLMDRCERLRHQRRKELFAVHFFRASRASIVKRRTGRGSPRQWKWFRALLCERDFWEVVRRILRRRMGRSRPTSGSLRYRAQRFAPRREEMIVNASAPHPCPLPEEREKLPVTADLIEQTEQ